MNKKIFLIIMVPVVCVLLFFFSSAGHNFINTILLSKSEAKEKNDFTQEEIDYLEKNILGINISDYGTVESGKIQGGRDSNVSLVIKNITNLNSFLDSIKNDNGFETTIVTGIDYEVYTYKVNEHRIETTIYKNDSSKVKISTRYIDDKLYEIFNIPQI